MDLASYGGLRWTLSRMTMTFLSHRHGRVLLRVLNTACAVSETPAPRRLNSASRLAKIRASSAFALAKSTVATRKKSYA